MPAFSAQSVPVPSPAVPRAKLSAKRWWWAICAASERVEIWSSPARFEASAVAHATASSPLAHVIRSSPVGKAGPWRRRCNSRSRVSFRCMPRSAPVAVRGCLSRVSSASDVRRWPKSPATWRKRRPGADRASGRPAESSGRMRHRSRAAVTCRVRPRSGVINAAVRPSSAALRRIRAMASASARGDAASIRVMLAVAPARSGRFGPSFSHWSVTGAGRMDRATSALRAGLGAATSRHGFTAECVWPSPSSSARKRYCGWSSPAKAVSNAAQTPGGRSNSNPGRTSAPCGSAATARMNSDVVPRDPEEPAMITGPGGGLVCQTSARCSTTMR